MHGGGVGGMQHSGSYNGASGLQTGYGAPPQNMYQQGVPYSHGYDATNAGMSAGGANYGQNQQYGAYGTPPQGSPHMSPQVGANMHYAQNTQYSGSQGYNGGGNSSYNSGAFQSGGQQAYAPQYGAPAMPQPSYGYNAPAQQSQPPQQSSVMARANQLNYGSSYTPPVEPVAPNPTYSASPHPTNVNSAGIATPTLPKKPTQMNTKANRGPSVSVGPGAPGGAPSPTNSVPKRSFPLPPTSDNGGSPTGLAPSKFGAPKVAPAKEAPPALQSNPKASSFGTSPLPGLSGTSSVKLQTRSNVKAQHKSDSGMGPTSPRSGSSGLGGSNSNVSPLRANNSNTQSGSASPTRAGSTKSQTSPKNDSTSSASSTTTSSPGSSQTLMRATSKGVLPRFGINKKESMGPGMNASLQSRESGPNATKTPPSSTMGSRDVSPSRVSSVTADREQTSSSAMIPPSGTVSSGIAAFGGPSSTNTSAPSNSGGNIAARSASPAKTKENRSSSPTPATTTSGGASSASSNTSTQASNNSFSTSNSAGSSMAASTFSSPFAMLAPTDLPPPSVKASKYLQYTSLNANLSDLPSTIWKSKYATLHTICVVGSPKLSTISPKMAGLKSLTSITMRGCGITQIASTIDHLGGALVKLDLGENKLETIPDWVGTVFTGLSILNIDHNALKEVPKSLSRLANLKSLDLAHNLFSTLDASLSQLGALTHLNIAHNNIVTMPSCVEKMKAINTLDASDNKLRSPLPNALYMLPKLTALSLAQNNLGDVPTELCLAPRLIYLNWSENKTKKVHDALWTLTKLQRLSLANNSLTELSERVSRLTSLQEFALEGNQFDLLPHQLFSLPQLSPSSLSIHNNPFRSIPSEIRSSSNTTAIYRFMAQLAEKAPWRRMKLMLVGNGNIGKTSLKRALSSSAFPNSSSSGSSKAISKIKGKAKDAFKRIGESLSGSSSNDKLGDTSNASNSSHSKISSSDASNFDPTDTIATDGIDIDDWVVDLEDYADCMPEEKQDGVKEGKDYYSSSKESSSHTNSSASGASSAHGAGNNASSNVAVLSCYDFAGQDVYYPTHSLFVTSRSIYLVMFSLKDMEGSRVEYWLQMVLAKAGYTSPVIIVATHEDDKSVDKSTIPDTLATVKKKYARFPFVKGVVSISSKTGSGIPQLRKLILTLALSHATMKEQVPRSYLLLEEEIKKRRRLCDAKPSDSVSQTSQNAANASNNSSQASLGAQGASNSPNFGNSGNSGLAATPAQASHEQQTVSLDEWHAMAERCFFKSKEDSMAALNFLADVGVVFYFKSDASGTSLLSNISTQGSKSIATKSGPAKGLNNVVILDPQWIADLLSTVISLKHNYIKEGVLDELVLPHLWKSYPRELHADLLQLLKRFEIVLPMATPGKFMVPSMLPKDEIVVVGSQNIDYNSSSGLATAPAASNPTLPSMSAASRPKSGMQSHNGAQSHQNMNTNQKDANNAQQTTIDHAILQPILSSANTMQDASIAGSSASLSLIFRLWKARDRWFGPMASILSMKFCPMGFFGRFVARALHLPGIKVISYSMSTFVGELEKTGERVVVVYNEWTYEVLVWSAAPSPLPSSQRTIMHSVIDCLEILHESLYSSNKRSIFIVCAHCISEGFSSPTLFLLEDALIAFTENIPTLPCYQCVSRTSGHLAAPQGSENQNQSFSGSDGISSAPSSTNSLPPSSVKKKFGVFAGSSASGASGTGSSSNLRKTVVEVPTPNIPSSNSSQSGASTPIIAMNGISNQFVASEGLLDPISKQFIFVSATPVFAGFGTKKDKCKSKSVIMRYSNDEDEDSSSSCELESSSGSFVGSSGSNFRSDSDSSMLVPQQSNTINTASAPPSMALPSTPNLNSTGSSSSLSSSSSNDSETASPASSVTKIRGRASSIKGGNSLPNLPANSNPSGTTTTNALGSNTSSNAITGHSNASLSTVRVKGRIDVPLEKIAPDVSFHSMSHLVVPYEAIKLDELVAVGGFAEIFKSQYQGETVAAKRFLSGNVSSASGGGPTSSSTSSSSSMAMAVSADSEEFSESFRELQHEAFLMAKLNHPNVVGLKALCVRPICMIMEWVPHGTLGDLLWGKSATLLPWATRLKFALDFSTGLAYLHSLNIMHLDFRSLNLLVASTNPTANVCIKVADFGLSTTSSGSHKGIKAFNPFWSSPEILQRSTYDLSTDIYSLGIVLWELLQQGRPFEEHRHKFPGPEIILTGAIASQNLRPTFPPSTPDALKTLISQCWHADPSQRPLASDVVRNLETISFQYHKRPSAWPEPLFNPPPPESL